MPDENDALIFAYTRIAGLVAENERLRDAITSHREGMIRRFKETGGDPNDQDYALWAVLHSMEARRDG